MRFRRAKSSKIAPRPSSGRSYAADAIKATAHPTRALILKALRDRSRSTVELETMTGENRYNLYHHLDVLQQVGLVGFRMGESRMKEFHLRKPRRPDTAYLQLEREDPEDVAKLERIVAVLGEIFADEIPNRDKITRLRILMSYPWSVEDRQGSD
jgi:DNA-binding transcriptional ArsR family regulator